AGSCAPSARVPAVCAWAPAAKARPSAATAMKTVFMSRSSESGSALAAEGDANDRREPDAGRISMMVLASRTRLLAAVVLLVDRAPGALFRLLLGHAFLAIAFFDVLGLAFLLVGIGRLVAA